MECPKCKQQIDESKCETRNVTSSETRNKTKSRTEKRWSGEVKCSKCGEWYGRGVVEHIHD